MARYKRKYETESRKQKEKKAEIDGLKILSKEDDKDGKIDIIHNEESRDNNTKGDRIRYELIEFDNLDKNYEDEMSLINRRFIFRGKIIPENKKDEYILLSVLGKPKRYYGIKDRKFIERYIMCYFRKMLDEKRYITIGGLANWLGVAPITIKRYSDRDDFWGDMFRKAYNQVETYLEEKLMDKKQNAYGIQFILQNRFGWTNKSSMDVSGNVTFEIGVLKPKEEIKKVEGQIING